MLLNGELYYDHREDDILHVIVTNHKPNRQDDHEGIIFFYHDEELVQIDFMNLKGIIKIKSEGKIFLPPHALIDVLNVLLYGASSYQLNYVDDSKFHVGKVVETRTNLVKISLGVQMLTFNESTPLLAGDKVVIALKGAYLNNKTQVEKDHICLNQDLGIDENPNDYLTINDDIALGSDFFIEQ